MLNLKDSKKEPIIKFISTVPGLLDVKEALPQKANNFIPSWWKDMPRKINLESNEEVATAKGCPSFTDYFSQGYILPAWSDFGLEYDTDTDVWYSESAKSPTDENWYSWTIHSNPQFLDHVKPMFQGQSPTMVFKGNSPWRIITRPGWSVMQVPLFYHFNNDLLAMPGIVDTDIMHEVNLQMLYFNKNKGPIRVKRGQPLVQYIPFKRNKDVSMELGYIDKSIQKKIDAQNAKINTKFLGSGSYRIAQRQRDNS